MKKTRKRILAAVMTLCLLTALLPVSAFAAAAVDISAVGTLKVGEDASEIKITATGEGQFVDDPKGQISFRVNLLMTLRDKSLFLRHMIPI